MLKQGLGGIFILLLDRRCIYIIQAIAIVTIITTSLHLLSYLTGWLGSIFVDFYFDLRGLKQIFKATLVVPAICWVSRGGK